VEVRGATNLSRSGSAWAFSDSNAKLTTTLNNHNLTLGRLVNIVESGAGSGLLNIVRQPVTDIVDQNIFKIAVPYSVTPRALAFPIITPIDDDVFVHQGGSVDVHVGDTVESTILQFTLDTSGKVEIQGPYFHIERFFATGGSSPDTVPEPTPFSLTYPAHTSRIGVSLTQAISGEVTLTLKKHPFSVGRMVKIEGWPTLSSVMYEPVTQVVDEDTVVLGRNLPPFSVGSGLTPIATYVYPSKDVGASTRQVMVADFGPTWAGRLVSFTVSKFKNLEFVQSYLELPENRVICADYLARGFDIYILDFVVTVYDTVAPSSATVKDSINTFLKSMAVGQEFLLSDLVAALTASGIEHLRTPLDVDYSFYSKDMFPAKTGTVTDALHPATPTSVFVVGSVSVQTEDTP